MPTPQTGVGPGFSTPTTPITGPGYPPTVGPGGASVPQTASGGNVPTSGPGSAIDLRTRRDVVQKQLDDLYAGIAKRGQDDPTQALPTNNENATIAKLTGFLDTLTQQITQAESKPATTAVSGGSPADKYIVNTRPDGTVVTDPTTGKPPLNPNYDGKTDRPQTVTVGNKVLNVANDGAITVAYNDQDAQNLANRQTAVAEANARTAALSQQTNDFATRAKVELDQRVANGEDAASVRAEQAQKLAELHQQWVESDGDARTKQEALRDYQTDRHATAQEQLTQQQIDATKQAQAMQDATARRGQDITQRGQDLQSQQAAAATRASLTNARLQAGSSYLGNTLGTLAEMNKAVQPGSSAVGDMLIPLMNLGQAFFSQMGGLQSPSDVLGGAGAASPDAAAAAQPAAPLPVATPGVADAVTPSTPDTSAGGDWFAQWQTRQAQDAAQQAAATQLQSTTAAAQQAGNAFAQSGIPEGTARIPAFATGGVVTKPTVALVGDAGPEAIVPLTSQPSAAGLTPGQQFFATLGAGVLAAQQQRQQAGQAANTAAQGAAALGHPPEAAANPMIPGSAVPGVPPAAAASQARMRPLAPDGSPYATPSDVASIMGPVFQKHGLVMPGQMAAAGGQG